MAQAESGDTVRVHYSGKLQDGSEFDSVLQIYEGCSSPFWLIGCNDNYWLDDAGLTVDIRGRRLPLLVVKPPFVRHGKATVELPD